MNAPKVKAKKEDRAAWLPEPLLRELPPNWVNH